MANLNPSLLAAIVLGLLLALLSGAVWSDVKNQRIPNCLVFAGAGLGLLLNSVLPEGYGFTSVLPGALGFSKSLLGLALGLAILLPLYMLRAMGAGDVKLMAMVGAFIGPNATMSTILLTFIIGGGLTLVVVLHQGTLGQLIDNLRTMLWSSCFKVALNNMPTLDAAPVSAGKLPYGIAIAAGTCSYVALERSGNLNFLNLLKFF